MCFTKFFYWWAKTKNLLQEKIATQPISPMTINCNHSCCAALHCCFRYFQIFSNIFAWYVHSHILQYIYSDNISWNIIVGAQRLPLPMEILQCHILGRGRHRNVINKTTFHIHPGLVELWWLVDECWCQHLLMTEHGQDQPVLTYNSCFWSQSCQNLGSTCCSHTNQEINILFDQLCKYVFIW